MLGLSTHRHAAFRGRAERYFKFHKRRISRMLLWDLIASAPPGSPVSTSSDFDLTTASISASRIFARQAAFLSLPNLQFLWGYATIHAAASRLFRTTMPGSGPAMSAQPVNLTFGRLAGLTLESPITACDTRAARWSCPNAGLRLLIYGPPQQRPQEAIEDMGEAPCLGLEVFRRLSPSATCSLSAWCARTALERRALQGE